MNMNANIRLMTIRVLERMEKSPEDARRLGLRSASGYTPLAKAPSKKNEKQEK